MEIFDVFAEGSSSLSSGNTGKKEPSSRSIQKAEVIRSSKFSYQCFDQLILSSFKCQHY